MIEVKAEQAPQKPEYPFIGIAETSGLIVLFSAPRTGTVLYQANRYSAGFHSNNWTDADFKPFDGEVILSNV